MANLYRELKEKLGGFESRLDELSVRLSALEQPKPSRRRKTFRCERGEKVDRVSGTRIDDSCGRTPRGLRRA